MSLSEADKRVVRAFVDERAADSRLLESDGRRLDKLGLGGETVARWEDGRIAIVSTESAKSDGSIIRAIIKVAGPGIVDYSYARKGHRVHSHGAMGRNGSADYPDQDAFIRDLQSHFGPEVNERQVYYRMRAGALHVTYVNLPRGVGSAGGGAESQNNRMSFDVDGFPSTTYRAMWGGKLKIEQSTTFDRSRKLRAKTASPSVIAQYLAAYLNKFAAEVPPRLTHTGGHTTNGRRSGKLPSERDTPEVAEEVEATFDVSEYRYADGGGEHGGEAVFEHGQWFVTCNCGAQWSVVDTNRGFDFERVSEGDEDFHYEPNGRRTGILSDGTRVNVYHKPGTLDEYTIVPHGADWDSMGRGGMRTMLGTSATGRGFSQWTEGQEGRHLGRSVAWVEVPEELKRHIESRVVGETMVANARRKKKLTYGDLPTSPGRQVLACPGCGEEYSAYRGDYFQIPDNEPCVCGQCGTQMVLAERRPQRGPEPQEARHTPGNRAWDAAEDKGLVRMVGIDEQENYFDVYGEPDTAEERQEIIDSIESNGLNMFASQYRKSKADEWETADSIGMIIGSLTDSGYEDSLKQAALDALKGHKRNARGSIVDTDAQRELTLYIENEYSLIGAPNSIGKSIDANLRKKVAKGTYDPALAPKGWLYLIDAGAKKHTQELGSGSPIFSAATRRAVATDFARAWEAETSSGSRRVPGGAQRLPVTGE